jgi:hypothetical protein
LRFTEIDSQSGLNKAVSSLGDEQNLFPLVTQKETALYLKDTLSNWISSLITSLLIYWRAHPEAALCPPKTWQVRLFWHFPIPHRPDAIATVIAAATSRSVK